MDKAEEVYRHTVSKLETVYGKGEAQSLSFLLLEHLYALSRTDILSGKPIANSTGREALLEQYIGRLNESEPIQYILGETEFYGYRFEVNPSVLIPRPETEELVHLILAENKDEPSLSILDIGTGSGCIAISLKKELANASVSALDVSEKALTTAKKNADLNNAEIFFIQKDILSPSNELPRTSIVVSNPPYVTKSEKALMKQNVLAHEPSLALFVEDHDPLIFYRTIAQKAKHSLFPEGKIYFEINEQFGNETAAMLEETGFRNIRIIQDLQGKDRMIRAQKI